MNEKEQLWYTRFLDYANSGLSQQRWCREHNLAQSTFRYWCNKFSSFRVDEQPEQLAADSDQWYEVSLRQKTTRTLTCQVPDDSVNTIRLQFRDLKMEFPAETDSRAILRIAKGLMRS